jgi:hypothetical protein
VGDCHILPVTCNKNPEWKRRTEAAHGMAEETAEHDGTDIEAARDKIMASILT